jgi:hypothetical protein
MERGGFKGERESDWDPAALISLLGPAPHLPGDLV